MLQDLRRSTRANHRSSALRPRRRVIAFRSKSGQRDRVLQHYLEGILFCDRCERNEHTLPTNRSGTRYGYFLCRGRQDGVCDLPYLPAPKVEQAIVDHYATLNLPAPFVTDIRQLLEHALAGEQRSVAELYAFVSRKLKELEAKEDRLLDLLADALTDILSGAGSSKPCLVVLREALSKQNTPFVKLSNLSNNTARDPLSPASPQVSALKSRTYRMTRQLTPVELEQVLELYRSGLSTYKLARQFGTNRHTIAGHLRRSSVPLRSRQKLTPQQVEQAQQLYADGHSLAVIGTQFGLNPTTIGKALRKAGVPLRDQHGRST